MYKRIWVSWSGGKDSFWALRTLQSHTDCTIHSLVCSIDPTTQTVPIQNIPRALIEAQAQALDLPVRFLEIPKGSSNTVYETVWSDFFKMEQQKGASGIAFGDLFLEDIRAYRERLCAAVGIKAYFPLFGANTEVLAKEMIASGVRAILTSVDLAKLPARKVGREFERGWLDELGSVNQTVDPCGENGEFHTFVYDGPGFRQPIAFQCREIHQDLRFAYQDLSPGREPLHFINADGYTVITRTGHLTRGTCCKNHCRYCPWRY